MNPDPAVYARAVLVAAVDLSEVLTRSRDTDATFNVAAIISTATPHLAPGWEPSLLDQGAVYALAIGLCHASSREARLHLRAALR